MGECTRAASLARMFGWAVLAAALAGCGQTPIKPSPSHIRAEEVKPEGTIPAREANRAIDALTERLLAWRDPGDGAPMLKAVYRREEIYRGPFVALAPDLLLDFQLRDGYSVSCLRSVSPPVARSMSRLPTKTT